MLQRILEPEVMDSAAEAIAYDRMDFTEVNTAFAQQAIALGAHGRILDAGTGTARIPILLCELLPAARSVQIVGIDLADSMLAIGQHNIDRAGRRSQIQLEHVDAKQMPYADASFDMVISNSIVHHLPDPLPFFRELKRVLKPNGGLFLRDLLRLNTVEHIDAIVSSIGMDYDPHQTQLFRDSLHAAFTLEEMADFLQAAGIENVKLYQSSDRHWTVERACKR
jgi:ubiquinone/menaquinone biosynthesis C-methylase UbiE